MASIIIRNLDESIKNQLRIRASIHNRSMEEEARVLLREGLRVPERGIGSRIHELFSQFGGVELELPKRTVSQQRPVNLP